MRIHIYDEEAIQSPSEHTLLNNLITGNSSTIIKQSDVKKILSKIVNYTQKINRFVQFEN